MQYKIIKGGLMLVAVIVTLFACSKYEDPAPAEPDPRLTRHYCNDPRAVNYNWGFPGISDSSVCIYPVDSFLGNWSFADTMYLPNGDTVGTIVRNLNFAGIEDTSLTRMAVTGLCGSSATPFYITANKYRRAETDTLIAGYPAQYLCNNTDTATGFFNKNTGAAHTMIIELTVTNAAGTILHKGTATKL